MANANIRHAKLQLPSGDEPRRIVREASEQARAGDMKEAQSRLRKGISDGILPPAVQRQVVAMWSSGCYEVLGPENGDGAPRVAVVPEKQLPRKGGYEYKVVDVMRKNDWSRKKAEEYIEEGGLEMEQMQKEMPHPMDGAIDKLKAAGPPQWFIDMMTQKDAGSAEGAGGTTENPTLPDSGCASDENVRPALDSKA